MSRTEIPTGTEHLLATESDGVAVLTMNRPERRNALSGEMLDGMARALDYAERAASVRCVVLTGAGGGFCAGGDVKGMAEGGAGRRDARRAYSCSTADPTKHRRTHLSDAETGNCHVARPGGGRGTVAGARVRPARHGRERRDHHRVRTRRLQRRLRRHVLSVATGRQRQSARVVLPVRTARRGRVFAAWHRQLGVPQPTSRRDDRDRSAPGHRPAGRLSLHEGELQSARRAAT